MLWLSPKPTNTRAEKSPNTEPSEVSKCVRVGRKTQFSQPANNIIIIPWNPHCHPQHMTMACNLWAPEETEARRNFFTPKRRRRAPFEIKTFAGKSHKLATTGRRKGLSCQTHIQVDSVLCLLQIPALPHGMQKTHPRIHNQAGSIRVIGVIKC